MPHDYYEDTYCSHGNNTGFYGNGCVECEKEHAAHVRKVRKSELLRGRIYNLLGSIPEEDWDRVEVKLEVGDKVRNAGLNPTGT